MTPEQLEAIRAFVMGGKTCQEYDALTEKGASVSLKDHYLSELLKRVDQQAEELVLYHKLHDGLSDMIEGGRLREADIPVDYLWLVKLLAEGV
jgi:hypothetical protein